MRQWTGKDDIFDDLSSLKEKLINHEEKILIYSLKKGEKENISRDELAKGLGISRASLFRKLKNLKKQSKIDLSGK